MEQYKYFIKGTVTGTRSYDMHTEDVSSEELVEYLDEIQEMFTRKPDDELAQYIWEEGERDGLIHGVVTEIWVGVKVIDHKLYSWTEVTANRELTEIEKEALLDYLTGQFSDGYGEGLEQHEFTSYTDTEECEEYDEENDEYFYDEYDVRVNMYLHLWQCKDFKLEIVAGTDKLKEDETVLEIIKPKCKLIGQDGNIFNLIGLARRALIRAGLRETASEMCEKVTNSGSYSEALSIIAEYVEIV